MKEPERLKTPKEGSTKGRKREKEKRKKADPLGMK
jgi:hypothetical protein